MTSRSDPLSNPYPGLRPFRESEAHLFFGRSDQTDELLGKMRRARFIAVLGASGSGKSSLVKAGLLPALYGGFSTPVGSHWRIAICRPGGNPIHNLALALAAPDVLGAEESDPVVAAAGLEATLRRSGLGLADAARRDKRLREGRILVIVDQFEELFRFHATTAEAGRAGDAAAFVQLLIEGSGVEDAPVDVVLTMRSDFLGDCSQFRDLPETINRGLYLVPRLTRSQLREAITAPAAVGGGAITPRLVQRLLNDAGADPDVLPVVQHALMRTWDLWAQGGNAAGPIDLDHYEAGGGVEEALSRHADEAYHELADDRRRKIAELMFKRLTELGADGREVRRPSPLAEISAVTDTTPEEVEEIIGHFEQQGRSFVTVSADDVVDISHESLIRQWPRLREWVRQEASSLDVYRRLASAADRRARGEAALLRDPDLQIAANWWNQNQPTQAWADRYNPAFAQAADYLKRSQSAATRRRLGAAAGVAALAILTVVAVLLAVRANNERSKAQRQERIAVSRQLATTSEGLGAESRVPSMLTALEALQTTEVDGLRLSVAEEALRVALKDPLSSRLPGRPDQLGHRGPVNTVAFSPDASLLATGSDDATALLWKMNDVSADPRALVGHEDGINALAFSPDGALLATGSDDATALLWDVDDVDADPRSLRGHVDGITFVAFSPDGSWLATGSRDTTAMLWSLDDPNADAIALVGHDGFVLTLAFSPDGTQLVTGGGDGVALIWTVDDLSAGPLILPDHDGDINRVAFSPDGQSVATASSDNTVRLWDLSGSRPTYDILEHRDPVNSLAFSPDVRWLVTGSGDRTARLWDLQNPDGPAANPIILRHANVVEEVAFSPASRWLASGSRDSTVRLWALDDPTADPLVLGGHEDNVKTLDFSADERWLASGSDDGAARLWDLEDLSTRPVVLGHEVRRDFERSGVTTLAFTPDGQQLATGTSDKTARLWDADDPVAPRVLEHEVVPAFPEAEVTALAVSPDQRWLATGSGDELVRLWDLDDPGTEPDDELRAGAEVTALAFSPDGSRLVAGVKNEIALVWDLGNLTAEPRALEGHDDEVTSLAFSADGQWLATGSRDNTVLLWRLEEPNVDPKALVGHEDFVTAVAFSSDGRTLASGSRDETVRLWDLTLEDPITVHQLGHDDEVSSVAFHPSGELLATAAGQALLLWDLTVPDPTDSTANPVVLRDDSGAVNAVAFSPDGQWLASGSDDETANLWLMLDELANLACDSAGRNFTQDEWRNLLPDEPYRKTCEQWPEGS